MTSQKNRLKIFTTLANSNSKCFKLISENEIIIINTQEMNIEQLYKLLMQYKFIDIKAYNQKENKKFFCLYLNGYDDKYYCVKNKESIPNFQEVESFGKTVYYKNKFIVYGSVIECLNEIYNREYKRTQKLCSCSHIVSHKEAIRKQIQAYNSIRKYIK